MLVTVTLALYGPLAVVAGSVTAIEALRPDPLASGVTLLLIAGEVATLATPVVVPVALVE